MVKYKKIKIIDVLYLRYNVMIRCKCGMIVSISKTSQNKCCHCGRKYELDIIIVEKY